MCMFCFHMRTKRRRENDSVLLYDTFMCTDKTLLTNRFNPSTVPYNFSGQGSPTAVLEG